MSEEPSYVGTEFHIYVRKPKQSSTVQTNETIYRPIASVDQTDIEFVIPGDSDTYVDLDMKLFVKGKLQTEDNTDLPETDYTAVVNNLLHSLFSQCTIYLNGTQITQARDLYPYRAYIETLSTYGNDADARTSRCPSGCSTKEICWATIAQNPNRHITVDFAPDGTD